MVDPSSEMPAPPAGPEKQPRTISLWSLLLAAGVVAALVMGKWEWLIAVLGLAFLIAIHEFGHFIAAKSLGMRVEKFYVGFPPAAIRHTWGETEYGIGIIPLGGFCKISGMTADEEVPEDTGDRAYYRKPVWRRNLTIIAGPAMNIVAAAVILILFVAISGVPRSTLTISEVSPGTPAQKAGLVAGDTLVSVDGQKFTKWEDATTYFRARPDKTVALTWQTKADATSGTRQVRTKKIVLGEHPTNAEAGYLGVGPTVVNEHLGPVASVVKGLEAFKTVVVGTFAGFGALFSGAISPTGPSGVMGPVGILDTSRDALEQHWYPLLLALISFNLGIINLLPLLPFDGGHLVVNVLEKVRRGKRLSTATFSGITVVVTALLIGLFIFLTYNDISRIFDK